MARGPESEAKTEMLTKREAEMVSGDRIQNSETAGVTRGVYRKRGSRLGLPVAALAPIA